MRYAFSSSSLSSLSSLPFFCIFLLTFFERLHGFLPIEFVFDFIRNSKRRGKHKRLTVSRHYSTIIGCCCGSSFSSSSSCSSSCSFSFFFSFPPFHHYFLHIVIIGCFLFVNFAERAILLVSGGSGIDLITFSNSLKCPLSTILSPRLASKSTALSSSNVSPLPINSHNRSKCRDDNLWLFFQYSLLFLLCHTSYNRRYLDICVCAHIC